MNRIDELDFFTGEIDQDAEQLNINLQGGDSLTILSMQQQPPQQTPTYALESSTSLDDLSVTKASASNNNNSLKNSIPQTAQSNGSVKTTAVQSNGSVKTTAARVIDLPSAGRTTDESTSQAVNDDDDDNDEYGGGDGNGDDYGYAEEEEGDGEDADDREEREDETPELPFGVGDKVEADYYGEGDYYPATVTAVMSDHQPSSYALLYDDGDTEDNVPMERMRLVVKAPAPKNAQRQGQGPARGAASSSSSSGAGAGVGGASRPNRPPQTPPASVVTQPTPISVVVPSSSRYTTTHHYKSLQTY